MPRSLIGSSRPYIPQGGTELSPGRPARPAVQLPLESLLQNGLFTQTLRNRQNNRIFWCEVGHVIIGQPIIKRRY
jgi:hypothetical protein